MSNETQTAAKSNSSIDALKRLERAGSENSRTTQKLREASVVVADTVVRAVEAAQAEGVELPRGYAVIDQYSNVGCFTQLRNDDGETLNSDCATAGEEYLHGDFNRTFKVVGRDGILQFAADIADGLLDEIAVFLEERAAKEVAATQQLEAVKI